MKTWEDFGIVGLPTTFSGDRKVKCPKCSHTRQKHPNEPCLSANGDKRAWSCKHCGWSGYLDNENQGRPKEEKEKKYRRPQVKIPENDQISPVVGKWFAGRGIGVNTLRELKIFSKYQWLVATKQQTLCMAFPYFKYGELLNVKYRDARKNMGQEKNTEPCMFNIDACMETDVIAITEGEIDVATAVECGFSAICSVDNGAPGPNDEKVDKKLACVKNCLDILKSAEKVILLTDKDAPGLRLEKELIKLLGAEKCLQTRYPSDCKDINDVLLKYGKHAVVEVLDGAFPVPVPGLHEFADYQQDINEFFEKGAPRGLSTGWIEFDQIYTMKTGTLNIITGIPTSGKSEWMHALMINMSQIHGWRWGLFSPEMLPVENLTQNFTEKIIGKKFFGKDRMGKDEFQRGCLFCHENIKLLIPDDDDSVDLDKILEAGKVWVQRFGIKGMLLDPYNEIEHKRPSYMTETEYTSYFLGRLRLFARMHDVWVGIIAHPSKLRKDEKTKEYPIPTPYEISGSANWFNKADYAISLWRSFKNHHDTSVEVHIQKSKNKWIAKKGDQKFIWDKNTGRYDTFQETPETAVGIAGSGFSGPWSETKQDLFPYSE